MPTDPRIFTATTTTQLLVAYNIRRTALAILNRSTSITAYLGNTPSLLVGSGFDLPPTGSIVFSEAFGDDPRLKRYVITASSTAELTVLEEFLEREP